MLDLTGITESTNPTVINGALMFPCTELGERHDEWTSAYR